VLREELQNFRRKQNPKTAHKPLNNYSKSGLSST
jgi:hypothetical protein